jgi:pimeloyl-ACP methyl ester carboxylesterase
MDLEAKAKELVQEISQQQYASAVEKFDATMKGALPADKLRDSWIATEARFGAFESITGTRRTRQDTYDIVFVSCKFAKAQMTVRVVYDADAHVAGLFTTPDAAKESPLREGESYVTFHGVGDVALAGTLMLPSHAEGKVPAVVLIAGSGPTDRDGNQAGLETNVLRQFAGALAQHGIASFRYDKRGIGPHATLPSGPELSRFTSWENYVGDAVAAVRWLRQQPKIDPSHVGVLGHSEGGMIGLAMTRTMTADEPAALVLVATPGRAIDEVIADQLAGAMHRQGAPAENVKQVLAENTRVIQSLREHHEVPADVPAYLAAIYPRYLAPFLTSELAFSPTACAAAYQGPVMVVQGERDKQILLAKDTPALVAALKQRAHDDHELLVIPAASHCLKHVTSDAEDGFEGDVDARALSGVGDWLARKFAH